MDIKFIKGLINNEKFAHTMCNLRERWLDECEYENINDYKNVLLNVAKENGFDLSKYKVVITKRPFGLKIYIDDKNFFRVYVAIKAHSYVITAKYNC